MTNEELVKALEPLKQQALRRGTGRDMAGTTRAWMVHYRELARLQAELQVAPATAFVPSTPDEVKAFAEAVTALEPPRCKLMDYLGERCKAEPHHTGGCKP